MYCVGQSTIEDDVRSQNSNLCILGTFFVCSFLPLILVLAIFLFLFKLVSRSCDPSTTALRTILLLNDSLHCVDLSLDLIDSCMSSEIRIGQCMPQLCEISGVVACCQSQHNERRKHFPSSPNRPSGHCHHTASDPADHRTSVRPRFALPTHASSAESLER